MYVFVFFFIIFFYTLFMELGWCVIYDPPAEGCRIRLTWFDLDCPPFRYKTLVLSVDREGIWTLRDSGSWKLKRIGNYISLRLGNCVEWLAEILCYQKSLQTQLFLLPLSIVVQIAALIRSGSEKENLVPMLLNWE